MGASQSIIHQNHAPLWTGSIPDSSQVRKDFLLSDNTTRLAQVAQVSTASNTIVLTTVEKSVPQRIQLFALIFQYVARFLPFYRSSSFSMNFKLFPYGKVEGHRLQPTNAT